MKSSFEEISSSFLANHPAASQGRRVLDMYLRRGKEKDLAWLLRDHHVQTIEESETYLRDEIDYFIQYFSFLALAWITGQTRDKLPKPLMRDAKKYLGNKVVQKYYSEYYEQLLPQIMLFQSTHSSAIKLKGNEADFIRLMRLDNSVRSVEIDSFLWMLDDGVYYERSGDRVSLATLITLLKNPSRFLRVLERRKTKTRLYQVATGFLLYCNFLNNYHQFLSGIKDSGVRSAYWHFYGYWFVRFEGKLNQVTEAFFHGLAKLEAGKKKIVGTKEIVAYRKVIANLAASKQYARPLREKYDLLL